ncbi:MAG: ABC transporter permease [candidate division Zixibacteria bacterium]|nr:ABC transporter permease [candidate division Zixibacteria bacterium]
MVKKFSQELREAVLVSIAALRANKMRSLLTMLGIIIGVGAVITMIALGQGAKKAVQSQIQSLGTNLLFVRPGAARQGFVRMQAGSSTRLTNLDAKYILEKCPAVESVAPECNSYVQLKYQNKNWSAQVVGTTPSYPQLRNATLAKGDFFDERDLRQKERVCVLGQTVYENLFDAKEDPVGKIVKINNVNYVVKGLLAPKGGTGWMNQDDVVLAPITTAQKRIMGVDHLNSINIQAKSELLVDQASLEIEKILRRTHKLQPRDENDFTVRTQLDVLATMEETSQQFTLLLAGIALVSLMVGGIGIMNIMLVSVTERTREIGIRMAIGARRRDIMQQFLIEALVLSLLGGLIGILTGIGGSLTLSKLAQWNTMIAPSSILLSFFFAFLVGIFFGLWPARKASRLDPIEALRYE